MQHLDRGAVAPLMDLVQHRRRGFTITGRGRALVIASSKHTGKYNSWAFPLRIRSLRRSALSTSNHDAAEHNWTALPRIASCINVAVAGSTTGAEYWGFDRNRSTSGSMMRLTVRLNGPPSSLLSSSTPGPIARHA